MQFVVNGKTKNIKPMSVEQVSSNFRRAKYVLGKHKDGSDVVETREHFVGSKKGHSRILRGIWDNC